MARALPVAGRTASAMTTWKVEAPTSAIGVGQAMGIRY